jgi:Fur family transcriptional regulator, ferric uptake regulator
LVTTSLDRDVEGQLRRHGIRYTKGRRAVIRTIAAANGPRSAAELHSALADKVPLSSLYRSLTVLEEAGVVVPHHGAGGVTRFEMAEWLSGHHHHLVCTECGAVEDIEIPKAHERRLRDLIADVSEAASFAATDHSLEIEGRCSRCR